MKQMMACLALAAMLGACGGGGGGGGGDGNPAPQAKGPTTDGQPVATTPPDPAPFHVLGKQSLPGRLLVNPGVYDSYVYDLQTGVGTTMPVYKEYPDSSYWTGTDGADHLTLTRSSVGASKWPVYIYNAKNLSQSTGKVSLPLDAALIGVSPNGKYLLAFLHDYPHNLLTVYDTATGAIVKQRSRIENDLPGGSPAAWTKDNQYVYFNKYELYLASPDQFDDTLLFDLKGRLPYNSSWDGGGYVDDVAKMTVSPQGDKLAFVWKEMRNNAMDAHIWILSDKGDLHRLTAPADPNDPLRFTTTQPTWSPDGKWIIGVLPVGGGVIAAPVFPNPEDSVAPAYEIISVGECASQVFALPATASNVPIDRHKIDPDVVLKVRTKDGKKARWLTECSTPSLYWLGN